MLNHCPGILVRQHIASHRELILDTQPTAAVPARERDIPKIVTVAVGVLLVVVGAAVIIRSIRAPQDAPRVTGRVVLVETGSKTDVRVTFEVDKDPAVAAECDR